MKKSTNDKLDTLYGTIFMLLFFFAFPAFAVPLFDMLLRTIGL